MTSLNAATDYPELSVVTLHLMTTFQLTARDNYTVYEVSARMHYV